MPNLKVGVITKPQGVKGEVKVFPTTDEPESFNRLVGKDVMIGEDLQSCELATARTHKGMVFLKFVGVDDRNAAEKFVGASIFVTGEQVLPLAEDEYFERDLIGIEVITEDGKNVGQLTRIIYTPANDVYVIKPIEGDAFMIPAIKDVVKNVSILDGIMTVKLLEGLGELTI